MNINHIIDPLENYLNQNPFVAHILKIIGVLILCWVVYVVTGKYLLRWLVALIQRTKTKIDDIFLRHAVFQRLAWIAPAIILYNFAYLFGGAETLVRRVIAAAIVLIVLLVVSAFLSAVIDILSIRDERRVQVKSYIQISKIILYVIGVVIIISALVGQSPLVLLSGIGALTAVLILVFRDTILSFIASLQISSYNLVKVGDWIEVPKYGADGDVIDIALHTVKVQNWDKTITMIPTHKLIEESFKNWRGMQQSGGRRIKRAVHIDMSSVRFCDDEMLDRFERVSLIRDYVRERRSEVERHNQERGITPDDTASGRRMTNLGTFRAYVQAYLRNHPKVHQGLTFLIRQLQPGPHGLPIEIYVFAADTIWANYEAIQADIFDHIIAVVPLFDLAVYQFPAGRDVKVMGIMNGE